MRLLAVSRGNLNPPARSRAQQCVKPGLALVARYAHQNGAHIAVAMDKLEAAYRRDAFDGEKVTSMRKLG